MYLLSLRKITLYSVLIPVLLLFSQRADCQKTKSVSDSIAEAYTANQPVYNTTRLVTPKPVIDGVLDDECWKHGNWAGDYHQFVPHEGAQPSYPTIMNLQYDDKNIYVAFRCKDGEPDKIDRMVGVRDELIGDMVGVNFDSYRDYRTGFEFTVTAWGQKVDLILFNPANWDFNWNPVWKVKTGLEDSAWVAEMEIPLSQLRYSGKDEQVWGLHTWRWISRIQEESNWEKQSKTGPGMLYNYGEFRGIKGLKKSRRLEIMPFALGELKTMEKQAGSPFTGKGRIWGGNGGLDAKIGVSSNFTIDLTVNPDFGQVESDPSVMNLTAFETFYEEKRPFFLEGLTIFDNKFDNNSLFYSRRIGHAPSLSVFPGTDEYVSNPDKTAILSAAKFSGTTASGLSVGLIQSLTAGEYARISDKNGNITRSKVEPLTNYTVARVKQGYNAGNTFLGAMFTSTNRYGMGQDLDFLAANAYTGGVDLLTHWKDKEYFLEARLLGSYVEGSTTAITTLQESSARYYQRPGASYLNYDPTRTSLGGYGGKVKIGKGAKGLWRYSTALTWLSPGLELNDLGYMNQSDEFNQTNILSFEENKPVSIFRTLTFTLEQFNNWNFNGTYLGSGSHLSTTAGFNNNWSTMLNFIFHSGATDTRVLRGGYDMKMPFNLMSFGGLQTDATKKVTAALQYEITGRGNSSAMSLRLQPGITIRPISSLKIGVTADWLKNRDELQYVTEKMYNMTSQVAGESGTHYILGSIDQRTLGLIFRVDLNITPEFSVQYYGSPFISTGKYSKLKYVTNPMAGNYEDRFDLFNKQSASGDLINLDYTGDGITDYSIGNPDFNFHQFRSNLVAKWEYRLGSFIYLVWSREKTGSTASSNATIRESYKELAKVFPNNIFLVKFSYWFTL